jgi:hypothetical protein
MATSGQEAHYEPIAESHDADEEASDYKLPDEPAPVDYALHPFRSYMTRNLLKDIKGFFTPEVKFG